jgi:hypothetical protein
MRRFLSACGQQADGRCKASPAFFRCRSTASVTGVTHRAPLPSRVSAIRESLDGSPTPCGQRKRGWAYVAWATGQGWRPKRCGSNSSGNSRGPRFAVPFRNRTMGVLCGRAAEAKAGDVAGGFPPPASSRSISEIALRGVDALRPCDAQRQHAGATLRLSRGAALDCFVLGSRSAQRPWPSMQAITTVGLDMRRER